MIPLTGKLLSDLFPNKPGYWAYRQVDDNQLLEIELTKAEWLALRNRSVEEENAKIDELNNHPLNVAAMELLKRAKHEPGGPGALRPLYVLSLAGLALPTWDEDQGPSLRLAEWTRDSLRMETAMLRLLESELDARELIRIAPQDAAKAVCEVLDIL